MNNSRMSTHNSPGEAMNAPVQRMQATVPLTSVDHGNTSTRSFVKSNNASHAPSKANSPSKSNNNNNNNNSASTSPSSHRSKRDSPAGSPSNHNRSNNASAFFSPPHAGELVESGFSPSGKRNGAGESPKAADAAGAKSAPDVVNAKKGRRGDRQGNANWFEGDKTNRPADTELNKNVATVNDGVTDQELARREQAERAQRQQEQLAQHISDPPTGFQATLPRLSELDVTNSWDKLLRMMRNEYDMSCLTNCLARELDEDIAWNPEMLLVQLTSDLMDAQELQKDNEMYVPVDESDIGQMTGGEVVRKRGEKTAPPPPTAAAPLQGASGGNAGPPPPPATGTMGFNNKSNANNGADGAASPGGAGRSARNVGGGPTATIVAPNSPAKKSAAQQRRGSTSSKAASGTANSPSKKENKPLSTKKSGLKSFLKKKD